MRFSLRPYSFYCCILESLVKNIIVAAGIGPQISDFLATPASESSDVSHIISPIRGTHFDKQFQQFNFNKEFVSKHLMIEVINIMLILSFAG